MSTCYKLIAALTIILVLVAGCGKAEPTPTTVPPTLSPTFTPVPPTTTPVPPTATDTPYPATETPAPTETPLPTPTSEPAPVLDGRGGGVIAYCYQPVTGTDTKKEIHAINADGSGDVSIINTDLSLNHHDWSPDAQKFAAVGYTSETTWSIYAFDADGTGLTRLTTMEGVNDNEPHWSPDGTKIVFSRVYPDQNLRTELWLMDADGENQRYTGVQGYAAKWSPDGSHFVYQSSLGEDSDLFTCHTDGSNVQQLMATAFMESSPVYAPDGTQIAYVTDRDGGHQIYIMDADGSNPRGLTYHEYDSYAPKWSPDGSLIAFGSGPFSEWEVFVINADGTNLRQVTHSPAGITAINPVWRPSVHTSVPQAATAPSQPPPTGSDGGMIAFLSDRAARNYEVYVMPAPGPTDGAAEPRRLATAGDGFCVGPSWSPDGQRIAYARIVPNERGWLGNHGPFEIWATTLDGAENTLLNADIISDEIVAFPWPIPSWSPDGTRLAFVATRETDEGTRSSVYVVAADGGGLEWTFPLPWVASNVLWSPRGDALLLSSDEESGSNVYVLSVQERELVQVYQNAHAIDWSPDGSEIVVGAAQPPGVVVLEPGGEPRTIAQLDQVPFLIKWSPDGKRILVGTCPPRNLMRITALHMVSLDTGELTTIAEYDVEGILRPNWSPESERVLYTTLNPGHKADLWVYDLPSGQIQQLTTGEFHDSMGIWSP
jgi:Tol biopolymer transport system component